jgi:AraC-like DNA-binding protein
MDVTLRHAALLNLDRTWHIGRHQHVGMHEMIVVLSGRIQVEIGGARLDGGAGSALHYPAGMAHEEWARGGQALTTVCIGWRGDAPKRPQLVADARGRLTELARWLAELGGEPGECPRLVAQGLMAALLHEFTRPGRLVTDDLVARVRTWALPRLAQRITLDDLARAAGLSRFHFVRAFRTASGSTPARWLRHQRLQAARTLLLTTDQPLRSIAPRVGFADQFQLSRVFRRDAGGAPSRLRSEG